MKKIVRFTMPSLFLCVASAYAADHEMTVGILHADFTDDFGARDIVSVEYKKASGPSAFVVKAMSGKRDYDNGDSFEDTSFSGTLYHDWNELFSTRTNLSASSDKPVFVNRVFDQDITYKGIPNAALTAGFRYSKYYGDTNSRAWYMSGAYYIDRLMVRYRYTHNELSSIGDSYGNLLTFRLKDREGRGSTQLWLGQGTSIQEYDWAPVAQAGNFKSVAIRRVQPITSALNLNASIEKAWYETKVADYEGVTSNLSLTYKW